MFLYKISSAIIVALITVALGWFGYVEASDTTVIEQSSSAIFGIRILISTMPALCFVLSAIFVKKLSLGKEAFEQVKQSIANKE
jgi:GPH family glycoside/pentoside/hexuronide:cation symporter